MVLITMVAILFAFAASAAAEGVLKSDMTPDSQVVQSRKYIMVMIKNNIGNLFAQIEAGNAPVAMLSADSIAAFAAVLPPLYAKDYAAVYPVKGSKTFFKPGTPADFEAASEGLRMEAAAVHAVLEKNDMAAAKAAGEKLGGACGACHSKFQGKYED
jgi:cytochrome c556